ncbi:NAD(P)-binding protein [Lindgomyces ingoldianus]|uniref:NAD(P)-binding protein n=1 Tax=Lindgomyces ingoldianus TaxID=673940 RepID=A0ACB6R7D2_9PLEO|nr:NAD(P)-binding protein [Lindgomyces ingoldianus]KAF2475164.1 NAD(P)-binding protein [Lindgomyces ingoldianus]
MDRQTVLIVGGAGAQGIPIVKGIDPKYAVRVLTRNPDSDTAKDLLTLPNVSIAAGDASNESDLRRAFQGVDLAFVNTNSFALGIRAEIFWGMRIFEIAVESGVKHYVWSALEDTLALSGYDEACRVGHYEGKSRVTEWMKAKSQTPMKWSVITTGPYIEMLHELFRPVKEENGTWVFQFPLKDGAIPFVHLEDVGKAVKWLLDHPEEAAGMNLKTTVEHASGTIIASAFTAVTGQQARYEPISIEQWFQVTPPGPPSYKMGSGYEGNSAEDPTLLTIEQNFGNWWHLYQRSGGNQGLIKTDYGLLDKIFPNRVKSVEEWMKKVQYTGERRLVIKNYNGR